MFSPETLSTACDRFLGWLDRVGYESYDPYDIWGTRYGLWSRKVYYAKGKLAVPLVAPIVAMDLLCPSLRRLFVKKARFATCDAQLLLSFLNLYQVTGDAKYLKRATTLGEEIMGYSIPGYSGPGWGYPFDWQNNSGAVWPKNTPYITCTPYCYEAYLGLYEATNDMKYLEWMAGIADFVQDDLNDTRTGANSAAGSYSPFDNRRVVNASAYRAYLLFEAGKRFARKDYLNTATRNLNFVLESQQDDGSWYYAMENKKSFIDNFHTCFNLKNLFKVNRLDPSSRVAESIRNGFDYYRRQLLDDEGNPKSFAVQPRLQVAKLEMYNFAEGITLGALIGREIPEALELARSLADKLISRHQLPDGHFVTRVFRGGIRHRFPFLRWPQAQLFYSLTNLFKMESLIAGSRKVDGPASPRLRRNMTDRGQAALETRICPKQAPYRHPKINMHQLTISSDFDRQSGNHAYPCHVLPVRHKVTAKGAAGV